MNSNVRSVEVTFGKVSNKEYFVKSIYSLLH